MGVFTLIASTKTIRGPLVFETSAYNIFQKISSLDNIKEVKFTYNGVNPFTLSKIMSSYPSIYKLTKDNQEFYLSNNK